MNIEENVHKVWPYLHSLPEPPFQEYKTSAFLAEVLRTAGYTVTEHVGSETGLVGVWDSGKAGPVVALRSDMDSVQFRRDDGTAVRIHACGHDAHMTMAITAAQVLAEQGIPCGKLKILFQPAEEIGKGALSLTEAGAIDYVQYLIGYHVMPKDLVRAGQISPQINWDGRLLGCCQIYRSDWGMNVFEEGYLACLNSEPYRGTLRRILLSDCAEGSMPCATCRRFPKSAAEKDAVLCV